MGMTGISRETWDNTESVVGFPLCPAGLGMDFEIVGKREGVKEDKRTKEPYEYVAFDCVHYDEEDSTRHKKGEFFRLDLDNLGQLKGFLEKIGRCDMMADNVDWEDIVGTRFTSDVRHTEANGETYANFVRSSIEALSHEFFSMADVYTNEEEEGVEPAIEAEGGAEEEETEGREHVQETAPAKAKKAIEAAKSTNVAPQVRTAASQATPRRSRRAATGR